jgi:hypothetical protein
MLRHVLLEIKNARGTVSLNDLSRKMGIERSALGGMLDHLVHKGHLRDDSQDIAVVINTCSPESCGGSCAGQASCPFSAQIPKMYSISRDRNMK